MNIELTTKQSEILKKELSEREFWTIKEAKEMIGKKLRLELSEEKVLELLENKFKKHFSTYRVSVGAILVDSGKKEIKIYKLEEGEQLLHPLGRSLARERQRKS